MSKLFLRAALVGCVAAGAAVAQSPPAPTQPAAPPVAVPVPAPTPQARATPAAPTRLVLKAFDVADLVCPPADSPLAKPGNDPAMVAAAKAYNEVRSGELLKAVRAATDGFTWDEFGGAGKLAVTTDGKALVVNNTAAEVDKVGACVESLRRLRSAQVKLDLVVFTVPSGNEAMVKLFGDKGHAAVSPDEMNKMLRELKAAGAADILTRPTLVLTNKQTGFCQVGEQVPLNTPSGVMFTPVGLTTRATPEVSADLKSVALALEFEHRQAFGGPLPGVNSQQTETKLVIPDGGSMAVKVSTMKVERKTETKVPVVSDIPYMGRLFHTVTTTSEPTDTVALVTATRMSECPVAPPVAVAPTVMPAPVPVALPLPVATVTPAGVSSQPFPTVRTVGPDGLERVGVNFTTLTAADTLPKAVPGVRVAAPPAVTLVRLTPDGSCVAGAVIGGTLSSICGTDETAAMMAAYKAACAAGQKDEATRLALQLLAKDPTCFGKK